MVKTCLRGLLFRILLVLAKARLYAVGFFARWRKGALKVTGHDSTAAPGDGDYVDRYFTAADGLRLHFRDYPHPDAQITVLCLHGLTRNAADFNEIAPVLNRRYRVIALDQRGRGHSDRDPNTRHYRPDLYVQDTLQLIRALRLNDVLLLGTSMGALMSIMLGAMMPSRFCGMILNEGGPVIEKRGLEQIRDYLKNARPAESWRDAEHLCRDMYGAAYPVFDDADWREHTRKTWFDDGRGNPVAACDPAVGRALVAQPEGAVPADLWPLFDRCGSIPLLVIRGELSQVLARQTVEEMCRRHPDCRSVTVANVGHAPTLAEPESQTAIGRFVDDIAARRCR